jgi:hypothetical protein
MRLARRAAKTVLVLFILCDVLFAWEWWRHGPPMVVSGGEEIKPGEVSFRMTQAPVTAHDYVVLAIVLTLQVALAWFLWWSRRRITRING